MEQQNSKTAKEKLNWQIIALLGFKINAVLITVNSMHAKIFRNMAESILLCFWVNPILQKLITCMGFFEPLL